MCNTRRGGCRSRPAADAAGRPLLHCRLLCWSFCLFSFCLLLLSLLSGSASVAALPVVLPLLPALLPPLLLLLVSVWFVLVCCSFVVVVVACCLTSRRHRRWLKMRRPSAAVARKPRGLRWVWWLLLLLALLSRTILPHQPRSVSRVKKGRTAGKWKAALGMAHQRTRSPLFAVQARNQSWKDQAHLLHPST